MQRKVAVLLAGAWLIAWSLLGAAHQASHAQDNHAADAACGLCLAADSAPPLQAPPSFHEALPQTLLLTPIRIIAPDETTRRTLARRLSRSRAPPITLL